MESNIEVVTPEVHTNKGRTYLVDAYRGNLWFIEIKVAHDGSGSTGSLTAAQKAEEAYRQIIDKNYATPFPNATCLGLCIDDKERQITASFSG